jgi:hypothetical protein
MSNMLIVVSTHFAQDSRSERRPPRHIMPPMGPTYSKLISLTRLWKATSGEKRLERIWAGAKQRAQHEVEKKLHRSEV